MRILRLLLIALLAAGCSSESSSPDGPAGQMPPPEGCVRDADCGDGEVCRDDVCSPVCAAAQVACGSRCCASDELCGPANACVAVSDCSMACGDRCCDPGQTCTGGVCAMACDQPLCGTQCCADTEVCTGHSTCCPADSACGAECCGAGQACEGGQCVVLGAPCDPSRIACATRSDDTGCPPGQVCSEVSRRCVTDRADRSCTFEPPVGEFDPVPLFTWGVRRARECDDNSDCQTAEVCTDEVCRVTWPHVTPTSMPEHFQVTSIPVVIDLDDDCVPEIVFNTFRDSRFTSDGVLRAIRGDDGREVWSVADPDYRTDGTANPAVGDADGDGRPEVYIVGTDKRLLSFDAAGVPRWTSEAFTGSEESGSPAIANLDGDGFAEVVYGAAVFDVQGRLLFEGDEGEGFGGQGPISCVADLDGDGRAEVVAGRTAYAFTGTVDGGDFAGEVRFSADTADGYCGLADLDGDRAPEVVLVASGTVYVLQGQTGAVLASQAIPGGGHGGAPNIADFDGDGRPDIATAGASRYVVLRYGGPDALDIAWTAPTEDDSSSRTGSSVFDFDGDGQAEVVYNDEEFVRIYPGREPDCRQSPPGPSCDGAMTDDEILFRDLNSSRTRTEYPVIADVDGDFKAEIVFATSNEASFLDPDLTGDAGIEVWRDRLDNWVGTPAVWNQHSYHVTNISLEGAIPVREVASWERFNSYRTNAQGERAVQCAPDLVVERIDQRRDRCPALVLEADVVNLGCLGVGPGVLVEVRQSDAVLGRFRTEAAIPAGRSVRATFDVAGLGQNFDIDVTLVVDADAANNECTEDNNTGGPIAASCRSGL